MTEHVPQTSAEQRAELARLAEGTYHDRPYEFTDREVIDEAGEQVCDYCEDDGAFIAAACNMAEKLLADLSAAEAECQRTEAALELAASVADHLWMAQGADEKLIEYMRMVLRQARAAQ